jgi:hypothetical protein
LLREREDGWRGEKYGNTAGAGQKSCESESGGGVEVEWSEDRKVRVVESSVDFLRQERVGLDGFRESGFVRGG